MHYEHYYKWFESAADKEHLAIQALQDGEFGQLAAALIEWLDSRSSAHPEMVFNIGCLFGLAQRAEIDRYICQWLSDHFSSARCQAAASFLRAYWSYFEDINTSYVEQFLGYLSKLPLGSDVDKDVSNMLADLADPAVVKNLPDSKRMAWRETLLDHLDQLERTGISTDGYQPVIDLRQGAVRYFFQIYNDIDNARREQERFSQLKDLCQTKLGDIQASVPLWLTEYEQIHRSYDDLDRVARFLVAVCPGSEMDRIAYVWYQEAPSNTRCEMMGWFLASYWEGVDSPYVACVKPLKEFVARDDVGSVTQQGPFDALWILATTKTGEILGRSEQSELETFLRKRSTRIG